MSSTIIDRGRGPEISGTRITVYDVLDYVKAGWRHPAIAALFGVSSRQVLAAIQYIEEHRDEVEAEHARMLQRDAEGNPPELQEKLDAIHEKWQKVWSSRQPTAEENGNERAPGGQ